MLRVVNRDMLRILVATFVCWTGLRLTEVALPLIALQQTGSVWATGLVAGSSGIALLTSPWWAARLRHRLTSGRALAVVLAVQALGHLTVAVGATMDNLTVVHLCVGGLIVGAATAVGVPATRAMLADLGDRVGPGVAVRALAWQDLAHRISMVASPPVAAWVVIQYDALPLMWADTIAVLLAAGVVARIGHFALQQGKAAVGWYWWFAFALGLAILGVETGRPGQLVAAGMAGYGIGSLAGAVTTPLVIARLPRVPTMVTGWIVLGATFMVLPWLDGMLPALALAAAVGGFATPFGIAALNALITEQTSGPERRTAFATQQVAATGGSSLGMLSGGAVIALIGAGATMHVAGAVLIAVPLLLIARRAPFRAATEVDQIQRARARRRLGWRIRRRARTAPYVGPGDVPPAPRLVAGPEPSPGTRTPLLVPPTDRAPASAP